MIKRLGAEFIGTFWLVLGGCGSAVLAANFGGDGNPLGIGLLGVALAFGLTVLTGAYALGHISGGHFNPAVSFGLWAGGRFSAKDLLPSIVAQTLGAIFAAGFCSRSPAANPASPSTPMPPAHSPPTVSTRIRRAVTAPRRPSCAKWC